MKAFLKRRGINLINGVIGIIIVVAIMAGRETLDLNVYHGATETLLYICYLIVLGRAILAVGDCERRIFMEGIKALKKIKAANAEIKRIKEEK